MNSEYNDLKEKYIEFTQLLKVEQNRQPYNVLCRRAFIVACIKSGYTSDLTGKVVGLNRSNCSHSVDEHSKNVLDKVYSKNYLMAMSMVSVGGNNFLGVDLEERYKNTLNRNSELYNNSRVLRMQVSKLTDKNYDLEKEVQKLNLKIKRIKEALK